MNLSKCTVGQGWMDGMSFSTELQSYVDNERLCAMELRLRLRRIRLERGSNWVR